MERRSMRPIPGSKTWMRLHFYSVRVEDSQLLHKSKMPPDEGRSDIPTISHIGDDDFVREFRGFATGFLDASRDGCGYHGPTIHTGRNELSVVDADFAVVKVIPFPIGKFAVEQEGQADGVVDHLAIIREGRRRENDGCAKSGRHCRAAAATYHGCKK